MSRAAPAQHRMRGLPPAPPLGSPNGRGISPRHYTYVHTLTTVYNIYINYICTSLYSRHRCGAAARRRRDPDSIPSRVYQTFTIIYMYIYNRLYAHIDRLCMHSLCGPSGPQLNRQTGPGRATGRECAGRGRAAGPPGRADPPIREPEAPPRRLVSAH